MAKKNNKKIKSFKKVKRHTSKKYPKRLGRKIKVREIKEEKVENIYGTSLDLEIMPGPVNALLSSDASVEKTDIDSAGMLLDPNYNEEAQIIVEQEDSDNNYEQPSDFIDQEEFSEPEPFENLSPRQKIFIMYAAITVIMLVIIGFWVIGLRVSLGQNFKEPFLNNKDLSQFKKDLNEFQADFGNIQSAINSQQKAINDFSDSTKQKIIEQQFKNEVTNKLKQKLGVQPNSNLNLNLSNTNIQ